MTETIMPLRQTYTIIYLDAVAPTHVVSNRVATDRPTLTSQNGGN